MSCRLVQMAASLLVLFSQPSPVCACSVPVFRYALERWPSDAYRVVVFHRGALTETQKLLAADLGPDGLAGEKSANLTVRTVDLDGQPDAEMLALWQSQKNATLPWMVVRYPDTVKHAPAWSGPMTESHVDSMLDSPARRELAKRILAGETSVWLFLESGDKKQDDAAYARLQKQLAVEESQLKLPDIDESDLVGSDAKDEIAKLKVKFSILRISRNDPKEKMLAAMLLGSEGSGRDSLRDPEYVNQPMAFPIFGRGRIRYGLVGDGIAEDTIHSTCAYLVGPCKCQIKTGVENRGMDLVMATDWNSLVQSTIRDQPAPPLQGVGTFKDLTPVKPVAAVKPRNMQLSVPSKLNQPLNAVNSNVEKPQADIAPNDVATPNEASETGLGLTFSVLVLFTTAGIIVAVMTFLILARKT